MPTPFVHWKLEESSGNRIAIGPGASSSWDLVPKIGSGSDGATTAIIGNGTDFYDKWTPAANTTGIFFQTNAAINFLRTHSFSWSFWMKLGTNVTSTMPIQILTSSYFGNKGTFAFELTGSSKKLSFLTIDSAGSTHRTEWTNAWDVMTGAWCHYVFTYDWTTKYKRIIVNATERANGTASHANELGQSEANTLSIAVGSGVLSNLNSDQYRNCSIYDEISYYKTYVLTDSDIKAIYNAGVGRVYENMLFGQTSILIGAGSGTGSAVTVRI
jgi:hypothetical protein